MADTYYYGDPLVSGWNEDMANLTISNLIVPTNQSFVHMHKYEIASGHEVVVESGGVLAIL